jgi:ribosome-binding factor A
MPAHRQAQIESTLHRAISRVLSQQLSDPRVQGMISVTRVTVSPDRHDAFVHVSVLPVEHEKRALAGLRHASGHIHALLCKAVSLKTVPRLDFRLDQSLKKQAVVLEDIARAVASDHDSGTPVVGA